MYNTYELDHNIEMMNKLSAVLENIQLECDYLTMTEAVEGESSETTEKKESLLKVAGKAIGKWIEKAWNAIQQLIENIAIRMRGGDKAVAREDVEVLSIIFESNKIDKLATLIPKAYDDINEFSDISKSILSEKKIVKKGQKIELRDLYSNLNKLKFMLKGITKLEKKCHIKNEIELVLKEICSIVNIIIKEVIRNIRLLLSKSISSDRLEKKDAKTAKKVNNKSNNESVYYKEDNIMNKNEYIASIMLEAAKLLKEDNNSYDDYDSLNEGIVFNKNPHEKNINKRLKTDKIKYLFKAAKSGNAHAINAYCKTINSIISDSKKDKDTKALYYIGSEIEAMYLGARISDEFRSEINKIYNRLKTILKIPNGEYISNMYADMKSKKKDKNANESKKEAMQEAVDLLYEKAVLCEDAAEAEGYIQKAEELQKAIEDIPEEKPETMDDYDSDVNGGEGEELDHEEIKDLCDGDEEVVKLLTDDEDKSVTVDSSNECVWW